MDEDRGKFSLLPQTSPSSPLFGMPPHSSSMERQEAELPSASSHLSYGSTLTPHITSHQPMLQHLLHPEHSTMNRNCLSNANLCNIERISESISMNTYRNPPPTQLPDAYPDHSGSADNTKYNSDHFATSFHPHFEKPKNYPGNSTIENATTHPEDKYLPEIRSQLQTDQSRTPSPLEDVVASSPLLSDSPKPSSPSSVNDLPTMIPSPKEPVTNSVGHSCPAGDSLCAHYLVLAEHICVAYHERWATDLILTSQGRQFMTHKLVVSAYSPVLASMLVGKSDQQPMHLNVDDLVTPETLDLLLKWMYTGCVDRQETTATSDTVKNLGDISDTKSEEKESDKVSKADAEQKKDNLRQAVERLGITKLPVSDSQQDDAAEKPEGLSQWERQKRSDFLSRLGALLAGQSGESGARSMEWMASYIAQTDGEGIKSEPVDTETSEIQVDVPHIADDDGDDDDTVSEAGDDDDGGEVTDEEYVPRRIVLPKRKIVSARGRRKKTIPRQLKVKLSKGGMHKCDECGRCFGSRGGLVQHRVTHKPFKCGVCNRGMETASEYSTHMLQHENTKQCQQCGEYITELQFAVHRRRCLKLRDRSSPVCKPVPIKKRQNKKLLYACPYCGISYCGRKVLSRHIHLKHPDEAVRHPPGGEVPTAGGARAEGEEEDGRVFHCDRCGKQCASASSLCNHTRRHIDEAENRRYSCTDCDKVFRYKESLVTHHITHHRPDKRRICEICGKTFPFPFLLKEHMMSHTGDKPFQCSYCDKTFTRPHLYRAHLSSHTGDKQFTCELCGVSFTRRGSLTDHYKQVHNPTVFYSCSTCGGKFKRRSHLKRHAKLHCKGNTDIPTDNPNLPPPIRITPTPTPSSTLSPTEPMLPPALQQMQSVAMAMHLNNPQPSHNHPQQHIPQPLQQQPAPGSGLPPHFQPVFPFPSYMM